jgi:hypothetical protein
MREAQSSLRSKCKELRPLRQALRAYRSRNWHSGRGKSSQFAAACARLHALSHVCRSRQKRTLYADDR